MQGKKINDILAELGSVAEGVKTSKAICELAKKLDIEVPVSSAIYEAVYTDITPQEVLSKLMNRKLKKEESYEYIFIFVYFAFKNMTQKTEPPGYLT